MKLKIKKGAMVEVVAGDDRGKKGTVLEIDGKSMKVKVQGMAMKTHFARENGFEKHEGYIHYSNLKFIEAAKPTAKKKAKKAAKKVAATVE